jgi:hypothetical protein
MPFVQMAKDFSAPISTSQEAEKMNYKMPNSWHFVYSDSGGIILGYFFFLPIKKSLQNICF